jgi:hypothetical protein
MVTAPDLVRHKENGYLGTHNGSQEYARVNHGTDMRPCFMDALVA